MGELITENPLDPADLTADEMLRVKALVKGIEEKRPYLSDGGDNLTGLPPHVYSFFVNILSQVSEGEKIFVLPVSKSVTTQLAANYLGMSRPFLVSLLVAGEINYHKVGRHRRILVGDLMEYARRRDTERRAVLDDLTAEIRADGMYDVTE